MCSSSLKKPIQGSLVILGSMSIGGTISKVDELANTLQVCFDSGAKKILLPMSSASDISQVPSELFSNFNIAFYNTPIVLWNTSGNSNNTQDYSKTDNNSSKDNDDLDDFILFNIFFNNKK